jgi:hypothetical protein
MTARQLLEYYENGRLTLAGFMLEVLSLSDKPTVAEVLERSTPSLRRKLKDFAGRYRPGLKIFNGPRPRIATVRYVRNWTAPRLGAKQPH